MRRSTGRSPIRRRIQGTFASTLSIHRELASIARRCFTTLAFHPSHPSTNDATVIIPNRVRSRNWNQRCQCGANMACTRAGYRLHRAPHRRWPLASYFAQRVRRGDGVRRPVKALRKEIQWPAAVVPPSAIRQASAPSCRQYSRSHCGQSRRPSPQRTTGRTLLKEDTPST